MCAQWLLPGAAPRRDWGIVPPLFTMAIFVNRLKAKIDEKMLGVMEGDVHAWASAARGRGPWPPLDFHTWYNDSR